MRLITELKRRNVVRVAAIYLSAAFATVEGVGVAISGFGVPDGALRVVSILAAVGFPIVIGLAWAFDFGSGGIRSTAPASTPEGQAELEAAARSSLLDGRTLAVVGILAVFGLGLGAGWFLSPGVVEDPDAAHSIAVLPFENRSNDDDALFFVDGVHDELLNQLSKISALRVISRSSVMSYRDNPKPIGDIAAELGVNTVLEGGVQRSADRVRVSVQLVDARTDTQMWAESYEELLSPDNLFSIQRDVSERISQALQAELSPSEVTQLATVPTQSQAAYDSYLLAKSAESRDDIWEMAQHLERAVEEDPGFAEAWAYLSYAYGMLYHFHLDRNPSRFELWERALDRAFELDPDLPEAYVARGHFQYWGFRDYQAALESLAAAERSMPNDHDIHTTKAAISRRMGDVQASVESFERGIRVNPLGVSAIENLAALYTAARDYENAEPWWIRARALLPTSISLVLAVGQDRMYGDGATLMLRRALIDAEGLEDQFGDIDLHTWLVNYMDGHYSRALEAMEESEFDVFAYQTYHYPKPLLTGLTRRAAGDDTGARRDFMEAVSMLEEALVETPDDARILASLGVAHAGLGSRESAVEAGRLATAAMSIEMDALDGPDYVFEVAKAYALLGDHEEAIDQLLIYFANMGRWSPEGIVADPVFRPLRDHRRFREVEAAAREWQQTVNAPQPTTANT